MTAVAPDQPVEEPGRFAEQIEKLSINHPPMTIEISQTLVQGSRALNSKRPVWIEVLFAMLFGAFPPLLISLIPIQWSARLTAKDVFLTALYWQLIPSLCFCLFVVWCAIFTGYTYRSKLIYIMFPACWGSICSVAFLISHFFFSLSAFPFFLWCQAAVAPSYCVPALYFAFSPADRQRQEFLYRFGLSVLTVVLTIVMFGVLYPLLNIPFQDASAHGQAGIAGVYILLRHIFEHGVKAVARRVKPDAYPIIVFLTVYAYEIFVSTVFVDIKAWWVFLVLLGFDMSENVIVIFHLCRMDAGALRARETAPEDRAASAPVDPSGMQEVGNTRIYEGVIAWGGSDRSRPGSEGAGATGAAELHRRESVESLGLEDVAEWKEGQRLVRMMSNIPQAQGFDPDIFGTMVCKVSVDVTKEFVEILAPLVYLVGSNLLRHGPNRELHASVAHATADGMMQSSLLLCVEMGVETILLLTTAFMIKRRLQVSVLSVFTGLLKEFWWPFVTIQWCVLSYFLALQFTPAGTDWTMQFKWLEAPSRIADGRPLPQFWGAQCWTLDGEQPDC